MYTQHIGDDRDLFGWREAYITLRSERDDGSVEALQGPWRRER